MTAIATWLCGRSAAAGMSEFRATVEDRTGAVTSLEATGFRLTHGSSMLL